MPAIARARSTAYGGSAACGETRISSTRPPIISARLPEVWASADQPPRRGQQRGRDVELERVAWDERIETELKRLLQPGAEHNRKPRQPHEVDENVAGQHRTDGRGEAPIPTSLC